MAMGLPTVTAVAHLFCFLLPKTDVSVKITLAGETHAWRAPDARAPVAAPAIDAPLRPAAPSDATAPLSRLAWTRSGDKGDLFNVGVIARRPEYYPYLVAALDEERIASWYAHAFNSPERRRVRRYLLPGLNALNFVLEEALGGGQTVGLRLDANAKSMAQQLLPIEIPVPKALLDGSDDKAAA